MIRVDEQIRMRNWSLTEIERREEKEKVGSGNLRIYVEFVVVEGMKMADVFSSCS